MKKILFTFILTILLLPQTSVARVMYMPSPAPVEQTDDQNNKVASPPMQLAPIDLNTETPQGPENHLFSSSRVLSLFIFIVLIGFLVAILRKRDKKN